MKQAERDGRKHGRNDRKTSNGAGVLCSRPCCRHADSRLRFVPLSRLPGDPLIGRNVAFAVRRLHVQGKEQRHKNKRRRARAPDTLGNMRKNTHREHRCRQSDLEIINVPSA